MSAEQTRKTINQLDKEIAALAKKSAEYEKKEAVAQSSAARVAKSIPKNASLSTRIRSGMICPISERMSFESVISAPNEEISRESGDCPRSLSVTFFF